MRFILFLTLIAIGIYGFSAGIHPEYFIEIFWGIFLPWIVAVTELYLVFKAKIKDPQLTTKVLMGGFLGKMVLFAVYLTSIIYFYSFTPLPFVISFLGSFLAFHTLEAIVLKSLFKS